MVKRFTTILVIAAALVLTVAQAASAASVHLKGGRNVEPTFVDNGLTLAASAEIAGLGNGDVLVTIAATGNPVATCQNPGNGEHFPSGQNPAPVTVTGSVSIPEEEIKNGTTPFAVETDAPVTPVAGAPDCPNGSWTEEIIDMQFTSAVITVEQPPGTVVLTVRCTINPATSDGPVGGGAVTCTSTN